MLKQVAFTWASALVVLAGTALTGCAQHDTVAEIAASSQVPEIAAPAQAVSVVALTPEGSVDLEKLLAAMTADPVVQADYRASIAYANEMSDWAGATPAAERDAKIKAYTEANARGEDAIEPAHTAAQQRAEQARSERAGQLIRAKYPQLAQLSPEDFGTLYAQVGDRIGGLPN